MPNAVKNIDQSCQLVSVGVVARGTRATRHGDAVPESLQVRRAQGAVVESVARAALFAPDHPSVVRPHRPGESDIVQRAHDRGEVDAAGGARMSALMELFEARALHVAAVHEMDALTGA